MEISVINDWIKLGWFFAGGLIFATAAVVAAKMTIQELKKSLEQLWKEFGDHRDDCGDEKKDLGRKIEADKKELADKIETGLGRVHERFDEIINHLLSKK